MPVGAEPSGVLASYGAYEITSDPVITLRKAATLAFDIPEGVPGDGLVIYQLSGASWTSVGGTVAGNRIRVPITELSIYGLFGESAGTPGTATVTNIEFSNRAFSPQGRRGGQGRQGSPILLRTTDISFELSTSATVRIEIYNRSGQLQTVLVSGRTMNGGRNVVTWGGRDHEDQPVRSGLYIVSIEAGGKRARKTVAVVNR